MLFNLKNVMLLLTTILFALQYASAETYSNTSIPDGMFHDMPVYVKSNIPVTMSAERMSAHIHTILRPLRNVLLSNDTSVAVVRNKRQSLQDGVFLPAVIPPPEIIQIEEYKLPFITSAQIGDYNFKCEQTVGDLVIANPFLPPQHQLRSLPAFVEFQIHPSPGVWWWVICVTFETGGAGMGITGVNKPGGDSGIDPNALKSLVG